MQRLTIFYIFILMVFGFSMGLYQDKVMAQSIEWSNFKNDDLGITFDYPSSWTMTEKTNRFEQGPDLSIGSDQQIFTYTGPTMDIQYFDAYVKGLSIGLNVGTPYSNLQIVENYNLNKFSIDGQPTATALYAYNLGSGERMAEQETLVYKDYQVHALKFRDSANSFDSPENQAIRDHMINSFHFIESPLSELEKLDRELAANPDKYGTMRQKADLLYELGNYTEAIQAYDKVLLDLDTDSATRDAVLKAKGFALYDLGKYRESIDTFERFLSIDEYNGLPYRMIGLNLVALGNLTGAISWYDKAIEKIEKDPYEILTLVYKGETLEKLGRYDDALASYDMALQVNSTDTMALLSKGNLLNFLGKYAESIPYYDQVLSLNPYDIMALGKKALSLSGLENHTKEIEYYDKILDIDPTNSFALNNKGIALSSLENHTGALSYFDKALEFNSTDQLALGNKEAINDIIRHSQPDEYANYFAALTQHSASLTKDYQDKVGEWQLGQISNSSMAKLTNDYLKNFTAQLKEFNETKSPKTFEATKNNMSSSFSNELKSYEFFRDYLITGNETKNQISTDYLSKSLEDESDAFKSFKDVVNGTSP